MRLLFLLFTLGVCVAAFAQQTPAPSLFTTVKPQGYVVVRKHPTGSEIVVVSMVDPKYPTDLLKQQAGAIAAQMGQEAQGLTVYRDQASPTTPDLVFIRAQLGVKGLADTTRGAFRLEPIVRAFAGAADPNTVTGLAVVFENMAPGRETLQRYDDDAVSVELSPQSGKIGVEYRIALKTQDPTKIHIPDARPQKSKPVVQKPTPRTDTVLIALGGVAALAFGALVYLLLLRVRPQDASTSRERKQP